jgi:hypothetical protein
MVMRLQSGAGNAAVSALIAERRPAATTAAGPTTPVAEEEAATAETAGATSGPETANAAGAAAPETANAAGAATPETAGAALDGPATTGPAEAATAGPESAGVAAAGVAPASPESASAATAGPEPANAVAATPESAGAPAAPDPQAAVVPAVAAPAASAAPAQPANGPVSAEGVAASVAGAVGGGALSLAGPASAPAAAAAGGLDLGNADAGAETPAVQEGPTDEELEGLEHEMGEAEAEKSAPAPEPQEDDGAVIARAALTDAPPIAVEEAEQDGGEPMDAGAIAAEAQGEMDAVGASGGGEYSGGGGGGGGAAIEPQHEPPAPDVSNADPAAAVSAAGSLKPAQMLETLGGADQAAANHAAKEEQKLAASPPAAMTGSAGGPSADERFPGAPAKTLPNTKQAAARTGGEPPAPPKAPPPPQRAAASVAPTPAVQGDAKGNVTQDDAARMQASIAGMPVSDPGAQIPGSGVAPKVILTGAADPGQMAEQQGHLNETVAHATAQGAQEAAEPAGEESLAPTIGPERIEAPIPTAPPATAAPGGAGASDDMAASVVADEQDGPALRAAAQSAAGEIGAQKQQHAATSAQHRAAANEEIAAQETKSQADQLVEHAATKAGVTQARGEWTGEQQTAATAAKTEAVGAITEAQTHIQAEKTKADAEAVRHVEAGQKEAAQAKQQGEQEAAQAREKAKQESSGGGFFGWVKSKATALYNSVREGITTIFNKVRTAITTAINKARELATSVISNAVKFVADKIKAVASKIVAIGDRLIPGFAALRQKFKTWIVNRVRQAVAALNRIVTAVKDGIRRTLQAVGKALSAAVDLLKKGMQAAINAVKSVVKAAIEKAKAAIAALGTFAALVKDIASGPGQWLSNLGAAVMDGIKNHLWKALKTAIAGWFNDKVEQVLGLGKSVWNLLTKGGIGLAQIGKMAWEALQAAIPPALIAILVEKLVSMIVPAAGAVLAIIQGLQAAWGAVQRILAAIDRFVAFLKAVKSGGAGPAFANAVAAAAVAVIEFVSRFLLRKVAGAASKIAGKIKAIAQKIGKRLLNAFKKVGKRVKGALNRGKQKLRDKFKRKTPEQKKQDKQQRLDKAVAALRPKIAALMASGTTGIFLKGRLLAWRLLHRLTRLEAKRSGGHIEIEATVNPFAKVGEGTVVDGDRVRQLAHLVAGKLLDRPEVLAAAERIRGAKEESPDEPTQIPPREGVPGAVKYFQDREPLPYGKMDHYKLGEHPVSQQQKSGETNAFVKKVGTYPEIFAGMEATKLSDARMAIALRSMVRTGELPEGISAEHGELISATAFLMFGRESHRTEGNVAMGPMTVDLIAQGNMSFKEAFTAYEKGGDDPRFGERGAYPQSMKGAPAAERGLAHAEDRPMRGTTRGSVAARAELKRREIELVTRWVETKFKAELGAIAVDETVIAAKIEKMVLGFYDMR